MNLRLIAARCAVLASLGCAGRVGGGGRPLEWIGVRCGGYARLQWRVAELEAKIRELWAAKARANG
jgi:hypothetical protein